MLKKSEKRTKANSPETILKDGGVGVLATDTLYGLVGKALDEKAVGRIYGLKKRQPSKPFIILIGRIEDLDLFGISLDQELKAQLKTYWPGPVSIVLPCSKKEFRYLHRGTNTLAFRVPAKASLRKVLKSTGPLVAPSANPEQQLPAETIAQAKAYFGDEVDFYKQGSGTGHPSKLIEIVHGEVKVLRP